MRKSLNIFVLLAAFPLLALPIAAQAQIQYTIADGQVTITNYTGSGDLVIPDSINGDPVTAIGADAFENSSVTGVTIPDSVTNIADGAFAYSPLESITVSASNPSYASVDGVLFDKALATLIQYPCNRAGSSYVIPGSVTAIGAYAFYSCQGLSSVTIPNSVTSIGEWAFGDNLSLTTVTIGNGVTTIGDLAFEYCPALTSVTIPDSVTSIGDSAFTSCGFTSVTIPASVTSIGDSPFDGCPLSTINVSAANPSYTSVSGVLFNKFLTTLVE